jgi:hypothetical protein
LCGTLSGCRAGLFLIESVDQRARFHDKVSRSILPGAGLRHRNAHDGAQQDGT